MIKNILLQTIEKLNIFSSSRLRNFSKVSRMSAGGALFHARLNFSFGFAHFEQTRRKAQKTQKQQIPEKSENFSEMDLHSGNTKVA